MTEDEAIGLLTDYMVAQENVPLDVAQERAERYVTILYDEMNEVPKAKKVRAS